MDKFISRKELEIQHSNSYKMRSRLKELGCEWDAIARAWIAPSLEVRELCYQILEEQDSNEIEAISTRFISASTHDFYNKIADASPQEIEAMFTSDLAELDRVTSIAHSPSKSEAEKIVGSENIKRYWRDEIEEEAASILASGENNWQKIYEILEGAGWKSRSVSLLKDVVDHFRSHPPIPAIDEVADKPLPLSSSAVKAEDMDGTIAVIVDKSGEAIAFKVMFPYNNIKINMIKWIDGRKWDASKKAWLVPIEKAEQLFKVFPHFSRSEKAHLIEDSLNK